MKIFDTNSNTVIVILSEYSVSTRKHRIEIEIARRFPNPLGVQTVDSSTNRLKIGSKSDKFGKPVLRYLVIWFLSYTYTDDLFFAQRELSTLIPEKACSLRVSRYVTGNQDRNSALSLWKALKVLLEWLLKRTSFIIIIITI